MTQSIHNAHQNFNLMRLCQYFVLFIICSIAVYQLPVFMKETTDTLTIGNARREELIQQQSNFKVKYDLCTRHISICIFLQNDQADKSAQTNLMDSIMNIKTLFLSIDSFTQGFTGDISVMLYWSGRDMTDELNAFVQSEIKSVHLSLHSFELKDFEENTRNLEKVGLSKTWTQHKSDFLKFWAILSNNFPRYGLVMDPGIVFAKNMTNVWSHMCTKMYKTQEIFMISATQSTSQIDTGFMMIDKEKFDEVLDVSQFQDVIRGSAKNDQHSSGQWIWNSVLNLPKYAGAWAPVTRPIFCSCDDASSDIALRLPYCSVIQYHIHGGGTFLVDKTSKCASESYHLLENSTKPMVIHFAKRLAKIHEDAGYSVAKKEVSPNKDESPNANVEESIRGHLKPVFGDKGTSGNPNVDTCMSQITLCVALGGSDPDAIKKMVIRLKLMLISVDIFSAGLYDPIKLVFFWSETDTSEIVRSFVETEMENIRFIFESHKVENFVANTNKFVKVGLTENWNVRMWDFVKFWAIFSKDFPPYGLVLDTDIIVAKNISSVWERLCDAMSNNGQAFAMAAEEPYDKAVHAYSSANVNTGIMMVNKQRLNSRITISRVKTVISEGKDVPTQWPPEQWIWNCVFHSEKYANAIVLMDKHVHCNCILHDWNRFHNLPLCSFMHYCNQESSTFFESRESLFSKDIYRYFTISPSNSSVNFVKRAVQLHEKNGLSVESYSVLEKRINWLLVSNPEDQEESAKGHESRPVHDCLSRITLCIPIGGDKNDQASARAYKDHILQAKLLLLSIDSFSAGLRQEVLVLLFWSGIDPSDELSQFIDIEIRSINLIFQAIEVKNIKKRTAQLEMAGLTESWIFRQWDFVQFWAIMSEAFPSYGLVLNTEAVITKNVSTIWENFCGLMDDHPEAFLAASVEPYLNTSHVYLNNNINTGVVMINKEVLRDRMTNDELIETLRNGVTSDQWPPVQWLWNCIIHSVSYSNALIVLDDFSHCSCTSKHFDNETLFEKCSLVQYCNQGTDTFFVTRNNVFSFQLYTYFTSSISIRVYEFVERAARLHEAAGYPSFENKNKAEIEKESLVIEAAHQIESFIGARDVEASNSASSDSCISEITLSISLAGGIDALNSTKYLSALLRLKVLLLSIDTFSAGLQTPISLVLFWNGVDPSALLMEFIKTEIHHVNLFLKSYELPYFLNQTYQLETVGLTSSWVYRKFDFVKFWSIFSNYFPPYGLVLDIDIVMPKNISGIWKYFCGLMESKPLAFMSAVVEPYDNHSHTYPDRNINSGVTMINRRVLEKRLTMKKLARTILNGKTPAMWPPEQWVWNCIFHASNFENGLVEMDPNMHCNCVGNIPYNSERLSHCSLLHYCNQADGTFFTSQLISFSIYLNSYFLKSNDPIMKSFVRRASNIHVKAGYGAFAPK